MHLNIPTMAAVLVEFSPDGRIRLDNEEWSRPTLQEVRAIIHAAETEIEELTELIDTMQSISG